MNTSQRRSPPTARRNVPRASPQRRTPLGRGQPPPAPLKRWWWVLVAGGLLLLGGGVWVRSVWPSAPSATAVASPAAATPPVLALTATAGPTARAATAVTVASATLVPTAVPPDIPALQQYLFELVNADRRAQGAPELAWDGPAAAAAVQHAQELAQFGYLSHWNLDGYGPDYRYHLQGGMNAVQENVYLSVRVSPPASAEIWQQWVAEAEQALLASPGHRANLLAVEHTHLGLGLAYNPATGALALAQELTNHYVSLADLPLTAAVGDEVTVAGRIAAGAAHPILNLAYEAFPTTLTVAELQATTTYTSPAET